MIYVKFDYFTFNTGGKGWSNNEYLPVFLNMDLNNPIGDCKLIVRTDDFTGGHRFYGKIESDAEIDPELYFYYLRDAEQSRCFFFKGINVSTEKLTYSYAKRMRGLADPYWIVINRPPFLLKHLIIDDIPGGYSDRQAVIIPMF